MSEPLHDDLHERSRQWLIHEVRKLRDLLSKQLTPEAEWTIVSGARSDGKPFLTMRWGEMSAQLSPAEARQHGGWLYEAAEAAETDGAVVTFMLSTGADEQTTAAFLLAMREHRGAWQRLHREGALPR